MSKPNANAMILWGGGLVVVLGLAFLLFNGSAAASLDRSALGVRGLAQIAPELGLTIEQPRRVGARKASELALSILPLYDMDMTQTEVAPKTRAEALGQRSLREMDNGVFYRKTSLLDTVVVLPKWTGGVIVTGAALPDFLIALDGYDTLLNQIGGGTVHLQRVSTGFVDEPVMVGGTTAQVALFHPQTFDRKNLPKRCKELAGLAEGALLLSCDEEYDDRLLNVLSDPDLLNTHGITKGQNADFLRAALMALQKPDETRPIYLDTATEQLLAPEVDEEAQFYDRDAPTLLRFFEWPLTLLWLAGGAVFLIALWRGLVRFGPVRLVPEDRLEISKRAAIETKAHLMRISRNDGQMVAEFVQARLQTVAEQTFGKNVGPSGIERLYTKLARTDADGAAQLRAVTTRLTGPTPPDLRTTLDRFKELLERLTHGS